MKKSWLFYALCHLFVLPSATAQEPLPWIDAMGAFVGEWHMDLYAHEESFGDRGGAGNGTMNCRWGLQQAWVDCELDSTYEGLGHYVLKIVLHRLGEPDAYGAFVTNSFGGGRLYKGKWKTAKQLVYHDAWTDPDRKWEYQRTTYTFHDTGEIDFMIEVSVDELNYLPHSSGTYRRK